MECVCVCVRTTEGVCNLRPHTLVCVCDKCVCVRACS